ncbi:helix-turn-helix domain-containing protein [Bradyrhizobium sp. Pha-3]|uniref:helix-turn-helix domain-containing protein n=1 Tax=Bradyrhizobium sp. Pha-3 TaxID=208375 RepID=UPI0035D496CF
MNMNTSSIPCSAKQAPSDTKGDKFTRDQFDWLRQVALDSELPPTATRVAIALTKYFNREHDGWAWMSQAKLALDLGMPERTVRFALSALIKADHLITKRRGRMETSLYHLALKEESDRQPIATHVRQPIAAHSEVTGKIQQSDRQKPARVTGNPLPPNPLKEPSEESIEEESDSPRLDLGEEGPRPREQTQALDIDAAFESFWNQYPRKVDKLKAKLVYRRIVSKKQVTPAGLLAGAMRYAAERTGQDPKYTKHATTWLNAGSWANEPAATPIADTIEDGNPTAAPPPHRPPSSNPHEARLMARLAALAAKGGLQ